MKRCDIITVTIKGDYGKPRPALILQSDLFNKHPSITIAPVTSELRNTPLFRYTLEPNEENGLKKKSQIMIDKITTIKTDRAGEVIGHVNLKQTTEINRLIAVWLGIA